MDMAIISKEGINLMKQKDGKWIAKVNISPDFWKYSNQPEKSSQQYLIDSYNRFWQKYFLYKKTE